MRPRALVLMPLFVAGCIANYATIKAPEISPRKVFRPPAVEVPSRLGEGEALLLVSWQDFSDRGGKLPLRLTGLDGTFIEVAADGKTHEIRVDASFPKAAKLKIGDRGIFAMFRKGMPVHLMSDMCSNWALLSANTDPVQGKKPDVLCRRTEEPCPDGFVASADPPAHHDERCPERLAANSDTAKICYRPGRVRFQSTRPETVRLVHILTDATETIQLIPGTPSAPRPLAYERCRPQGVRIGGETFFFAIGFDEQWLVTITDQGITATVEPSSH